jgi:CRP/FNR family transcriptional regulator
MTAPIQTRRDCLNCPLLGCEGLRPLDQAQLKFMQDFKQGEFSIDKGTQALVQGSISPHVYTVLQGVLFRYRILEDGRRAIVNFVFPGDLIGLQGAIDDPLMHGCDALTAATLCVFSRDRVIELFAQQPRLGYDLTWLAAKEESALEELLVSIGRRTAQERLVYLAIFLIERGIATGLVKKNSLEISITQSQISDTLGLSLVHTNRTLQSLRKKGMVNWSLTSISIPDLDVAREFAHYEGSETGIRPYI